VKKREKKNKIIGLTSLNISGAGKEKEKRIRLDPRGGPSPRQIKSDPVMWRRVATTLSAVVLDVVRKSPEPIHHTVDMYIFILFC
jgi:hypothetical protein